jgi:two-component system response regulator RpaA
LTNENYRVSSVTDGQSGVEYAVKSGANCIILDYDLPNGCGAEIIEVLKRNEKTKEIPIIVLTAVHKRGLEREMLNKGANSFMTKPFEFSELRSEVKRLVYGDDE